jgi:catechol 2,3-dioxygenase-like lactoylglutathione lyase family enzyme
LFDHVDFAVENFQRSREFYVHALAPLGVVPLIDIQRADGREGTGFGVADVPRFWIGKGQPISGRFHLAFEALSRNAVVEFYTAALAAGGIDYGAPGLRVQYGDNYYAAYVRDPDGHVLEAVCRRAEA